MRKQFKAAVAAASPVYSQVIGAKQEIQEQDVHDDQNTQAVQDTQQVQYTQGRKGMKQPRINMAFTPENLGYLRTMAGIKGISITKYVNDLILQDREKNADTYNEAKRITESI